MEICKDKLRFNREDVLNKPEPVPGHVYKLTAPGVFEGNYYLATRDKRLWDMEDGHLWSDHGFGSVGLQGFADVTDKVCLKVKE